MSETPEQKAQRLFDEEEGRPPAWWWLSFASADQSLGVVIVLAPGFFHAVRRTHHLGINPGGEVQGMPLPKRMPDSVVEEYQDRLLSRAEVEEAGFA